MNNASKTTPVPRRLACLFVLAVLGACGSAPADRVDRAGRADRGGIFGGTNTADQGAGRQDTAPATAAQDAIPDIATVANDNRRELIDAINRDGVPTRIPGYREERPEPVPNEDAGEDGEPEEDEDVVELNYEQAELSLVLRQLAEALDISIILDPSIDRQISIRTAADRPLRQADVWPVIQLLTRDAGIVLERIGNIYNTRVATTNVPVGIAMRGEVGGSGAASIMQITPLTYISLDAAQATIEPLLDSDGSIRRIGFTNTLAISASEAALLRINQLLDLIDSDPFLNQGIRLYELSNGSAPEVATELSEILVQIEGDNPAYQVRGIERINALLVTAPATRGFSEIERWVRILDADSQEQVEQLFHYQVKNLNAVDLASTLSEVFGDGDREDAPAPAAATPAAPAPSTADESGDDAAPAETPATPAAQATEAVSADLTVNIVADEATNSLLIRSTARDYRQLLTTIRQLDAVPLQVMINAVIAQITLTDTNSFGVDWSRIAADAAVVELSTETRAQFLPDDGLGGLFLTKTFLDGAAQIDATLQAIATYNDVRLLARPSLTVLNNQEGEIQIGAQVPVEQGQTLAAGGNSTTNIQYRDTGIVLSITPQINSDDAVNLIIRQELSSVDRGASGVNNNPVFNNQEINTTVVVRNGENVVLGGLIQSDDQNQTSGVPLLSKLPILGGLFSYQRLSLERRELFIVLRPEIINLNEQSRIQYRDILERFELTTALIDEQGI